MNLGTKRRKRNRKKRKKRTKKRKGGELNTEKLPESIEYRADAAERQVEEDEQLLRENLEEERAERNIKLGKRRKAQSAKRTQKREEQEILGREVDNIMVEGDAASAELKARNSAKMQQGRERLKKRIDERKGIDKGDAEDAGEVDTPIQEQQTLNNNASVSEAAGNVDEREKRYELPDKPTNIDNFFHKHYNNPESPISKYIRFWFQTNLSGEKTGRVYELNLSKCRREYCNLAVSLKFNNNLDTNLANDGDDKWTKPRVDEINNGSDIVENVNKTVNSFDEKAEKHMDTYDLFFYPDSDAIVFHDRLSWSTKSKRYIVRMASKVIKNIYFRYLSNDEFERLYAGYLKYISANSNSQLAHSEGTSADVPGTTIEQQCLSLGFQKGNLKSPRRRRVRQRRVTGSRYGIGRRGRPRRRKRTRSREKTRRTGNESWIDGLKFTGGRKRKTKRRKRKKTKKRRK